MIFIFFFNDTATTEIYTLSLHDTLPIFRVVGASISDHRPQECVAGSPRPDVRCCGDRPATGVPQEDRKSTRLNSSHANISYAVFCLKKTKRSSRIVYMVLIVTTCPTSVS